MEQLVDCAATGDDNQVCEANHLSDQEISIGVLTPHRKYCGAVW